MEPKIPAYTRVLENVENFLRLTKIFTRTLRGAHSLRTMERAQGKLSNSTIHFAMTEWAGDILTTLNVHVEKVGQPSREEPVLFVGNHISYVDIPLLMFVSPVVFVAKKQLGSWPVIGTACRSVGTILVDRDSKASRKSSGELIAPCIQERRQSVCIYPSGTTSIDESTAWRWGPFQIAARHSIPVQPFRIRYDQMERAAFLLEDSLLPHLWRFLSGGPIKATVEFHSPVLITDPEKDARRWWEWARESRRSG